MKQIDISGSMITRDDGSTVHPVVYLDADSGLLGKAYVPEAGKVRVPDDVAEYVVIDDSTNLAEQLPQSAIGNIPGPAETAMDKIEKLDVPDNSSM
jgi:hypothetical protein